MDLMRKRSTRQMSAVVAMACLVAVAVSASIAPAAHAEAWSPQNQNAGSLLDSFSGAACPTASHCVALGTNAYTSDDGGGRWSAHQTPAWAFRGVSCPTAADCWAVASTGISGSTETMGVFVSTDGGSDWSAEQLPSTTDYSKSLTGISCPTTTTCWAVGSGSSADGSAPRHLIFATTDGGASWTLQSTGRYDTPTTLSAISCATAVTCVAVGADASGPMSLTTSDGGASWARHGLIGSSKYAQPFAALYSDSPYYMLTTVACPTANNCWAGAWNGAVLASTDGGQSWGESYTPQPGAGVVNDISCPTTTVCVAVGGAGAIATSDGGSTWKLELPLLSGVLQAVACAPAQAHACWAFGGHGEIFARAAAPLAASLG